MHTHFSLVYTSGATLWAVFQKIVSSCRKTAAGGGGRSAKCLSQWSQQSPRTQRMEDYYFPNLCDVLSDEIDDNIHIGSHAFQDFGSIWKWDSIQPAETCRWEKGGTQQQSYFLNLRTSEALITSPLLMSPKQHFVLMRKPLLHFRKSTIPRKIPSHIGMGLRGTVWARAGKGTT